MILTHLVAGPTICHKSTAGTAIMTKQPNPVTSDEAPALSNTVVTPAAAIELNQGELSGISGGDAVVGPIRNHPTILFTSTTKDKVDTFTEYSITPPG
jgi:hypothetical protein